MSEHFNKLTPREVEPVGMGDRVRAGEAVSGVTIIHFNGPGGGNGPKSIDELLALMETQQLDSWWAPFGKRPFIAVRDPEAAAGGREPWIDGPPLYPDRPLIVRFKGQFVNYSHAFCIDTDDPDLIYRLRSACESNLLRSGSESRREGA